MGAPEEAAEQEAPAASAAASDSATPRRSRRRGGDARAAQEASATVHALDPADAGTHLRPAMRLVEMVKMRVSVAASAARAGFIHLVVECFASCP